MLDERVRYCYNDIAVVPSIKSGVEHRCECNPYDGDGNLPIFASPMSTVVSEKNFSLFEENAIIPILPRNISYDIRIKYLKMGKWVGVGLSEFESLFIDGDWDMDAYPIVNVVIDIANGHMVKLHDMILNAKVKYGFADGFKIMCGNVANAKTYYELSRCGVDYVRLGIGGGSGCITSSNTAIHFPMASLISETYEVKNELERCDYWCPKIIADGGVRNYCDVIKALALGADYVMIGGLFAQLVESAADTFYYDKDGVSVCEIDTFECNVVAYSNGTFGIDDEYVVDNLHKVFYGMASRKGQEDINGEKRKTSEGIEKVLKCTTNVSKWKDNMVSYMRSAMSYTNCLWIDEFNPSNVDTIVISHQTKESINL